MISSHSEGQTAQVIFKMAHGEHHCQELSTGHAVALLSLVEHPAEIRHYPLPVCTHLRQHSSSTHPTVVTVEHKRERGVSWRQRRCIAEAPAQLVERPLACICPDKLSVFMQHLEQRGSDARKTPYKPPVVE